MALLDLDDIGVTIGDATILNGVSLSIAAGRIMGLVGGSGSGKTTLARVAGGLRKADRGTVFWEGKPGGVPLGGAGFVFQDPHATLNPRKPLWWMITEPAALIGLADDRRALADRLLAKVGLDANFADRFAHQLSGGQRQRVAIGRALSTNPKLLILDEPTSALDVSVQARILNLLLALQQDEGVAMLLVSHDLAVVRHLADDVAVMTQGRITASGPTAEILPVKVPA